MILFLARPQTFFFFSWGSTLGVCDLTLPARASDPWTFPLRKTRRSVSFLVLLHHSLRSASPPPLLQRLASQ